MTFIATKLFHKAGEGSGGGGGGDHHNLGWYATQSALEEAHPTASNGDYAIVGSTDTVWVWDSDTTAWKDTDTKGQVTSVNGQTGAVTVDTLPDQTGQSGKFLTTDGTDASWATVSTLPSTSGNNNKLLLVNYGNAVWSNWTYVSEGAVRFGRAEGTQSGVGFAAGLYYKMNPGTGYAGIAIGASPEVLAPNGIAMGSCQRANAYGAIQIGTGDGTGANMSVNSDPGTMNVALKKSANNSSINVKLLDSDGTIPTARLTKVNTAITLAAADWSSNTQTVSVTGVTADGIVMVSPDPTDQSAYTSAGIICSAQAAGSLTFTCDTVPSGDLSVNVVML